jgi:hypothetical protein
MEEEKKEHEEEHSHEHHRRLNLTNKFRENPWMLSTLICGVLVLALLFVAINGGITGNISADVAGEKLLDFYESMGIQGLTLKSVKEVSGLYEVQFDYQGNTIPLYITKDGKAFTESLSPIESDSPEKETANVPKSDKPNVELYIWSYCPYGVTALGPLAEVASLLKDSADFKVKLYYAGHGDFEVQQNKIQACIQKLSPSNYWAYAKTFADEIYTKCSGDIACDLKESTTLMKSLGIDSSAILFCVDSQGETLTDADYESAKEKGVSGSPTLVVNGVKVSASRTAEAYKGAVCSAFTDGKIPTECGETLSSSSTSASGSC